MIRVFGTVAIRRILDGHEARPGSQVPTAVRTTLQTRGGGMPGAPIRRTVSIVVGGASQGRDAATHVTEPASARTRAGGASARVRTSGKPGACERRRLAGAKPEHHRGSKRKTTVSRDGRRSSHVGGVDDGIRTRDIQIHNLNPDSRNQTHSNDLRQPPLSLAHPVPTDTRQTDPDLALIVERWGELPEAVRAGMVAMVRASAPSTHGEGDKKRKRAGRK